MNFFEQELRRLFGDGNVITSPSFSGRICLGSLGNHLRARASFTTTGVQDNYTALLIQVIDPMDKGEVDRNLLQFEDVWGTKAVPNRNFSEGIVPYIWENNDKVEWYAYRPTDADMNVLRQEVRSFLEVYRDQSRERESDKVKTVYICVPLHGDVKANIEFARQKASEEFAAGNIPVCPHFLTAPSVKANQPKQVAAAREMGMKMLESCQEVHVYGEIWTDRMWAEIYRAQELGLPVMTDQHTIGHSPRRRQTPTKGVRGDPSR